MVTDMEIESNSTENNSSMIKIKSNDGQLFLIDRSIVEQSSLIKELTENIFVHDDAVPLHNVNASLLSSILEFCNHHKNDPIIVSINDDNPNLDAYGPRKSDDISAWDEEFIKQFNAQDGTLADIISAANYLGVTKLVTIGLKTLANMIRGKSASEVRNLFSNSNSQSKN